MKIERHFPFAKSFSGLVFASLIFVSGFASAATLTVEFKPEEGAPTEYEEVNIYVVNTATARSLDDAETFHTTEKSFSKAFENLSPGQYMVLGFTGPFEEVNDASRLGAFRTQIAVVLDAEETEETVTINYEALDTSDWSGQESARGRTVNIEGDPVSGTTIKAVAFIETAGELEIDTATSDEDGYFEFDKLAEGKTYDLVDSSGSSVGEIAAGGDVTVKLAPQVGQEAPNVEFVHLESGETQELSDFEGKVVVLEFWASWCGPCQAPMAKMQTYREKHPEWGEDVELIALSIDNTKEAAVDHLEKNGWNSTYNTWAGDGGFRAKAPTAYGVQGIPTMYLIDQNGKIAATGHPMSLDTPALVNDLLAD